MIHDYYRPRLGLGLTDTTDPDAFIAAAIAASTTTQAPAANPIDWEKVALAALLAVLTAALLLSHRK